MENYDVINTPVPTSEDKEAAVKDLAGQALKNGILSQVIPSAAIMTATVIWMIWMIWYFSSLVGAVIGNNAFYNGNVPGPILYGAAILLVLIALCAIPGIILGRIAWKRGNLARAGAIDVGIFNPPKAIVGKILGIVAFFSGIASIVIFLYDGLLFGGIGLFAGKLF